MKRTARKAEARRAARLLQRDQIAADRAFLRSIAWASAPAGTPYSDVLPTLHASAEKAPPSSAPSPGKKPWVKPAVTVIPVRAAQGQVPGPLCDKHGSLSSSKECP